MDEMTKHSMDKTAECIAPDFIDGHHQLVATKDFEVEDHILRLDGEVIEEPSRFSVQIGPGQHMDLPAEAQARQPMDRYLWRFLNHSCEPNAEFKSLNLMAIRKIKASEQITFDYNTTESDLSSPFECHCGSDNCYGLMRGRRLQQEQAEAER